MCGNESHMQAGGLQGNLIRVGGGAAEGPHLTTLNLNVRTRRDLHFVWERAEARIRPRYF